MCPAHALRDIAGETPARPGFPLQFLTLSLEMRNLQLLNREISICENTNFTCDAHGFLRHVLRGKLGVLGKRARGGQRVGSAGTNRANAVVGLDYVTIAGYQKRRFRVRDNQQRLQVPQCPIFAPFLGQLNSGFRQVSLMLLQLALKTLEKRKRIGGGARKPRQNFVAEQAPRLPGCVLHHMFTHGDLAVRRDHHFVFATHAKNRGAMYLR